MCATPGVPSSHSSSVLGKSLGLVVFRYSDARFPVLATKGHEDQHLQPRLRHRAHALWLERMKTASRLSPVRKHTAGGRLLGDLGGRTAVPATGPGLVHHLPGRPSARAAPA